MPPGNASAVFPAFVAVWVLLGAATSAFFFLNKDAALKRKVWPVVNISLSVLFVAFTWMMGFPDRMFWFVVPAVALVTVLNMRSVRFCDSCGKTLFSQNFLSKPEFCSKCGAKLAE